MEATHARKPKVRGRVFQKNNKAHATCCRSQQRDGRGAFQQGIKPSNQGMSSKTAGDVSDTGSEKADDAMDVQDSETGTLGAGAAEALFREALEGQRALLGGGHADTRRAAKNGKSSTHIS